jgi:hypothetical protein
MSFSCWMAIGSPPLNESKNTLRAFNGSGFKPYGVLSSLPVTLEGKTVQVEVEVFDTPLDYNLLLGCSWVDSMRVVVSTLFRVVRFPHQEKVVTVDQLAFFNADTRTGNMSFIANTPPGYENVGVSLLKDSSLMGTFPIPPPPDIPCPSVASINMISTVPHELPVSVDPWIVPDPGDHVRFGNVMPLSPVESTYQAIQSTTPTTCSCDELSPDPFRVIFPTDEMIMYVVEATPWDDGHHHFIGLNFPAPKTSLSCSYRRTRYPSEKTRCLTCFSYCSLTRFFWASITRVALRRVSSNRIRYNRRSSSAEVFGKSSTASFKDGISHSIGRMDSMP